LAILRGNPRRGESRRHYDPADHLEVWSQQRAGRELRAAKLFAVWTSNRRQTTGPPIADGS